MHASLERLISLRDGEPIAADVVGHVRDCAECDAVMHSLSDLHGKLRAMPGFSAPADSWQRILLRLDAQAETMHRRFWIPAAGIGLAASLAVVLVLVTLSVHRPDTNATVTFATHLRDVRSLTQLQSQSQYLENAVLSMNADTDHRVVNAGTAAMVAALEDRIALIDYAINQTGVSPQPHAELAQLWQQRVDLLQSLTAVRYAQVAGNGI
ncbi:MAG: hypothetical protein ACRESE_09450 [Gammaproteobacteria bacterium]